MICKVNRYKVWSFRAHKYFNNFKIIKCADINKKAAENCAKIYKIEAVSVNDILKDKEIEVILNLTIPTAHYLIAKKSLLNGKHVYSEKPLAVDFKDGLELIKISRRKKLFIGNAPDTFLGGGNQKARQLLDKKIIGKIKFGTAILLSLEFNHITPIQNLGLKKRGVDRLLIWVLII